MNIAELHPLQAQAAAVSVLVVDDERLNRAAVAELLQPHYRILLAKDGPSALAIALNECSQLGLVLLDVSMPGMSGYEVLTQLRADTRTAHIPVIFITGQSDEAAEEYGLRLGAADYVSKPIRPAVLLARAKNQIDLLLRKRELEQLALADGLTGLANRRHFDAALQSVHRRCLHSGETLGLALIDIDHFKQFNDNYGHLQGDDALRSVAQVLKQHAQRSDEIAARYGGEEFAFIGLGSSLTLPAQMEKFRVSVSALETPHITSPTGYLTVSTGLVIWKPTPGTTLQEVMTQVDQLLYEAKAQGRNRLSWAIRD